MKPSFSFMFYLAGLSMLGYLATDMYLPAFSQIQDQLNTTPAYISASLSIFLAGFAFAQLIWGPLSDRFGRRVILIIGLSIFAISSLAVLWITTATQFLVLRFIQSVGVCSAAVIWQALVIDRCRPNQTKRVFATIMPLVALSPALAPLLGAWITEHLNWRDIFVVLFITTLLLLIPTFFLHNQRKTDANPVKQPPTSFLTILRNPLFAGNVMIYATCSAAFFAWLTGSPYILSEMGYSPKAVGLSYIPQTIAFLAGGFGCRTLLNYVKSEKLFPILLIINTISVLALYLVAIYTDATLVTLLIPFCTMAMVNGASYPIAVANALTPFARESGKAAALQNALQLGLCFLASLAVSYFVNEPLTATATVMLSTVLFVFLGYAIHITARRKEQRSIRDTREQQHLPQ